MNALPKGHGVLLLGPTDEVIEPTAIAELGFTVVQCRATEEIGPCAVSGCKGTVYRISVPVLIDPLDNDPRRPGATTLHEQQACLICGCHISLAQFSSREAA
jgi:hypothetical protein